MKNGTRFRAYPRYKESSIKWLGEIPVDWQIRPLKRCGRIIGGSGFPDQYQGVEGEAVPFYKVGDLAKSEDGRTVAEGTHTVTMGVAAEIGADIIPANSIIYAKIGAALMLNRRRLTTRPCCIDNNMSAFIPTGVDPIWSLHWMSILDFRELANPGAVPSLSEGYQATLPMAMPPKSEQRAIGKFLDRETAKIDELMAKKKRLVELLEEKRAALITHAVTRGLNPDAPLRDSGIEWLGEIPKHWEVKRLSLLCAFEPGQAHEPFIDPEGAFICVNSRFVSTEGEIRKYCTENQTPTAKGDILMVMSDLPNGRALAKAYHVQDDAPYAVNQRVCRLSPFAADSRYLFYLLSRSPGFLRFDDGSNQTHLPNAAFTKFPTATPPLSEQTVIAEYLDGETAKIDRMAKKVKAAIEYLIEYRSALITAAVTGTIDVRDEEL